MAMALVVARPPAVDARRGGGGEGEKGGGPSPLPKIEQSNSQKPQIHQTHAGLGIRLPGRAARLLVRPGGPAGRSPAWGGAGRGRHRDWEPGADARWQQPRGCSTLLVHCLTVLISSWITRSTHLRQGSFSFTTCFFTMASNAKSGVKSPVLEHPGRGERAERDRSVSDQGHAVQGLWPLPTGGLGTPRPRPARDGLRRGPHRPAGGVCRGHTAVCSRILGQPQQGGQGAGPAAGQEPWAKGNHCGGSAKAP